MTLATNPIPTIPVLPDSWLPSPGMRSTTIPVPDGRLTLVETRSTLTLVTATTDGTACAELSDAARDQLLDALYASRLRGLGVTL